MLEREIKLAVPAAFTLPDLGEGDSGLVATVEPPRQLNAHYLDTTDLRLARWGVTLRHRNDEGWVVKLPHDNEVARLRHDAGDSMVRDEVRLAGSAQRPPAAATTLLAGFTRGEPLARVARLVTRRQPVTLALPDGTPVAEIDDDEVSVHIGRRLVARFREVEVELVEGADPDLLGAVVARLRTAGAGDPDPTPKLIRALGPPALEPSDVVIPNVRGKATVREVIQATVARSVRDLIVNLPGVHLDDDPEAVHQVRIATRRLRSALRTFATLVDGEWAVALRADLADLGARFGSVRDADVLVARLRAEAAPMPSDDAAKVADLVAGLEGRQAAARAALTAGLATPAMAALLDRLVAAAAAPPVIVKADERASEVIPPLGARPWRRVSAAARAIGPEPTDDDLHALRLRVKRVRYAAEACAPAAGGKASAFARRAKALQDVLGDHQDATFAAAWLREAAVLDPRLAFVAGQLAGRELERKLAARAGWRRAYQAMAARQLASWR